MYGTFVKKKSDKCLHARMAVTKNLDNILSGTLNRSHFGEFGEMRGNY
jgi:hypothetical protein